MLPIRNLCDTKTLTARAPAKLIISGEHSVLYGQPALAVAVDRYTTTTTAWHDSAKINFKLPDLNYQQSYSSRDLQALTNNLQRDYSNYLSGNSDITSVLKRPFELLQYSVAKVLSRLELQLPYGLEIAVNSSIPIGCGMGSSAAAIVSTLYALTNFFDLNWRLDQYLNVGREIENLQHGKSSGLDLHIVTHGGYVRFQNGQIETRNIPNIQLQIINTGQPLSSTGECVSSVAPWFAKDAGLAGKFGAITNMLDVAISTNNFADFKQGIKLNHQLLNSLGVVPTKVANLIKDIEILGGAAKICGAGAIRGDNAGAVLLVSEHDMQDDMQKLVQLHGYSLQHIQVEAHGTKII